MSDNKSIQAGGMSASSLLGIAFIVLKLCAVINWSWWWVLAPFWLPACAILVVIAAICALPAIVLALVAAGALSLKVVRLFKK